MFMLLRLLFLTPLHLFHDLIIPHNLTPRSLPRSYTGSVSDQVHEDMGFQRYIADVTSNCIRAL